MSSWLLAVAQLAEFVVENPSCRTVTEFCETVS